MVETVDIDQLVDEYLAESIPIDDQLIDTTIDETTSSESISEDIEDSITSIDDQTIDEYITEVLPEESEPTPDVERSPASIMGGIVQGVKEYGDLMGVTEAPETPELATFVDQLEFEGGRMVTDLAVVTGATGVGAGIGTAIAPGVGTGVGALIGRTAGSATVATKHAAEAFTTAYEGVKERGGDDFTANIAGVANAAVIGGTEFVANYFTFGFGPSKLAAKGSQKAMTKLAGVANKRLGAALSAGTRVGIGAVEAAISEGTEEVVQGIAERMIIRTATGDTSINPIAFNEVMLEFGLGATLGGIIRSGIEVSVESLRASGVNLPYTNAELQNLIDAQKLVQDIQEVDTSAGPDGREYSKEDMDPEKLRDFVLGEPGLEFFETETTVGYKKTGELTANEIAVNQAVVEEAEEMNSGIEGEPTTNTLETSSGEANIEVPVDKPTVFSEYSEPQQQVMPFMVPEETVEVNQEKANARTGITGPKEIPGIDDPSLGTGDLRGTAQTDYRIDDAFAGTVDQLDFTKLGQEVTFDPIEAANESGGVFGKLNFLPALNVKGTNLMEVIDSIGDVLNIFSNTVIKEGGKIGHLRGANGYYDYVRKYIRVKSANSITTAAHELGHAISFELFWRTIPGERTRENPWTSKPTALKKELAALGKELYGGQTPAAGYMEEGFAEATRVFIVRADALQEFQQEYPETYRFFTEEFLPSRPDIAKAMKAAQLEATRYQTQTTKQRARNSIDGQQEHHLRKKQAIRATKRGYQKYQTVLKEYMVDDGAYLQEIEELGQTESLKDPTRQRELATNEKPYSLYSALRGTAGARLLQFVKHGAIDAKGVRIGPSLEEAFAPVKGQELDALLYLYAKRTKALHGEGPNVVRQKRATGLSLEDANRILEEIEGRSDAYKFETMAQKVYDVQDHALNYAAQMAPLTFAPIIDRIRRADPGFYIPLQRVFRDIDKIYTSGGNTGSGVFQKLKGSMREIQDPFDSIVKNIGNLINSSHNRAVLESVMRISRVEGMGGVFLEVSPNKVPMAKSIEEIFRALETAFRESEALESQPPIVQEAAKEGLRLAKDVAKEVEMGYATLYTPAQIDSTNDWAYLPIWDGKKVRWYEMPNQLYGFFKGDSAIPNSFNSGPVMRTLYNTLVRIPTRLKRLGYTSLNASFSLITNPLRDISTLRTQLQGTRSTPVLLYNWMQMQAQAIAYYGSGKRVDIGGTNYFNFAEQTGATSALNLAQDRFALEATREKLLRKSSVKSIFTPSSWLNLLEGIEDVFSATEMATRSVQLKVMAEDMGVDISNPDSVSFEDTVTLMNGFKRSTTDFSAAGKFGRWWNQAVPFFNANIQGPRQLWRTYKRSPALFYARIAEKSMYAALLWYWNKDKDWWQELTSDEKYMYSWISMTDPTGGEHLIRIPRAFEADGMSMAITEALLDSAYDMDPEAIKEWLSSAFKTAVPLGAPVMLQEIFDQVAGPGGYDHFWDRAIVPFGLTQRSPEEQVSPYTTDTAQFIGGVFGVSPIRVEHAMRGIIGNLPVQAIQTIEAGNDTLKELYNTGKISFDVSEPSDIPLLGKLFNRGGAVPRFPKSVQQVFEDHNSLYKKRLNETPEDKNKRLLLNDAKDALVALTRIGNMTKNTKDKQAILNRRIIIAQKALAEVKKPFSIRTDFTIEKKLAENKEKLLELQQ